MHCASAQPCAADIDACRCAHRIEHVTVMLHNSSDIASSIFPLLSSGPLDFRREVAWVEGRACTQ